MNISNPIAVLLCVVGMVIVGSSISISQLVVDYPHLTGQAARYALAALVLAAIARYAPGFLAGDAGPTPDAGPSRNADPTRNAGPTRDADPSRDAGPTPDAGPTRDADPTRDAGPSRDADPSRDATVPDRRANGHIRATGWPSRREWMILTVLAGTGLAAFNACILIALPHADPAVVGTFIGAAPLGLALLGPLLRGGRPAIRLVVAAGIVVAGTGLVQGNGRADAIGVLAAIGALAGEIAFSLLAAAVLPRLGPVRVAAYSCALAVPLLLLAALPAGEVARWRLPSAVEATTLGYLAALMTVVAFLAWFTGLRQLGVERAGVLVGLMPVATLVTAAVQAGRLPNPGQSAGVLVVAAGLAVGLTARGANLPPQLPVPLPPQLPGPLPTHHDPVKSGRL